ncbi:MAG: DUF6272 family protein [Coleofasciculaceae cyanobacterium]
MTQIFGDFIEDLSDGQEYLIIGFSPSTIPLEQRWRNNSLSADFLANYLTTFFAGLEEDASSDESNLLESTSKKQMEIKSAVSYIANELIENAMKFNDYNSDCPISLGLQLHDDRVIFITTNSIKAVNVPQFQEIIKELTTVDPQELYIKRLEQNAENDVSEASQLGFLTMMSDYMTKIGWKFETVQKNPEVVSVTTMVQLEV